jgi:hypothetical protein
VTARVNLAICFERQNRLPQAELLFREALGLDPRHMIARSHLRDVLDWQHPEARSAPRPPLPAAAAAAAATARRRRRAPSAVACQEPRAEHSCGPAAQEPGLWQAVADEGVSLGIWGLRNQVIIS